MKTAISEAGAFQTVQKLMVESMALRLALPVVQIGQLSLRLFDELPGRTNSFAMPIPMTDFVGALKDQTEIFVSPAVLVQT